MVIIDKVLDILNSINDIKTVIYDSGFSQNLRIDRKEDPFGLVFLLNNWQLDISSGIKKEKAEVEIFFAKRANFDATGEEKDVIVSEMEQIAENFIGKLLKDSDLNVIEDSINIQSCWGRFDAFLVGVSLRINLEEKQGSCI